MSLEVPFIGPRSRFNIVGINPSWVIHETSGGAAMNGEAPRTVGVVANDLDPVVSAGRATFLGLSEGGLFTLLGNYKKSLVVEEVDDTTGGSTKTIVNRNGDLLRNIPAAPFKLLPGEYLKVTGGSTDSRYGVLVRLDAERIL